MTAIRLGSRARRTIDFVGSGRLAVMLLLASAFIIYVYLVVPQINREGERAIVGWLEQHGATGSVLEMLGLTDVLGSWLFWAIYALLLVNLSVCMTRRFSLVIRLCSLPDAPPGPGAAWLRRELATSAVPAEQVATTLSRSGYRTVATSVRVYGIRGRFASIGHWVFHAGLLAILIVGGVLASARPPFGGSVGAGEGEPFDLHAARLVSANQPVDPALPPLQFRVDRVDVLLAPDSVRQFEVVLSTPEGDEETLAINRPFRSGPYQVLVHGFGFMPGWAIVNPRGRALQSAWVKLLPFPLEEEETFPLGSDESHVTVRFYPDHEPDEEGDRTRGPQLDNPRFRARIVWKGQDVYDGLLAPGERVRLEGGREFFFLTDVRRYALLDVVEERGQRAVFSCFGVMIAGLLLRYGRLRKEIVVEIGEKSLRVCGHGEIFENLFAEDLDRVTEQLAQVGSAHVSEGGSA